MLPDLTDVQVADTASPVVFVNKQNYNGPEELLLGKILGAAKQDMNAVVIHQLHNSDSVNAMKAVINNQQLILSFGVSPLRLGLVCDKRPYQLINIAGKTLLFSHNLTDLGRDPNKKKALWAAIKDYYQL